MGISFTNQGQQWQRSRSGLPRRSCSELTCSVETTTGCKTLTVTSTLLRLMSMEILTFHRYNRLARRGLAKPLACPHCGHEYTLRATVDAEPVLQCNWCNSLVQPGLGLYTDILAVVKEHYV